MNRPQWLDSVPWGTVARILALILVIALTLYLVSIRDRVKDLGAYGYPGIFLLSLLSNATLILPVPGVLFTSAMGAVFNPFWVAIAAGSGAALGELSGYLAGFSGQKVVARVGIYEKMEGWMRKYGEWVILLLAFVPNPAFDMAGIIAGALRMRVVSFLLWCMIGKILKMLLFAYGGSQIIQWFPWF